MCAPRVPWLFPADWDGAPLPAIQFRQLTGASEVRSMKGVGSWALGPIFYIYLPGIIVAREGACLRLRQCLDLRNNPNNSVIVFTFYSFKRSNFLIWILHTFHSKINPWRSLHVPTQIIYIRANFPNHQGATLTKSKQEFTPRKAQWFKYLFLEASALDHIQTFFPAKETSTKGSTRFFLSALPPNISFTVCEKASSTGKQHVTQQKWNLIFLKG